MVSLGGILLKSLIFLPIKLYISRVKDLSYPYWNSKLIAVVAGIG